MRVQSLSAIRLFVTPWALTRQVPLWHFPGKHTGMPFLSPGVRERHLFPTQGSDPHLLRLLHSLPLSIVLQRFHTTHHQSVAKKKKAEFQQLF